MSIKSIATSLLNGQAKVSLSITGFGLLGWVSALAIATPSETTEKIKEHLRQQDDHRHGEIWDLHFCADDGLRDVKANISYPEPTTTIRKFYTLPDGSTREDAPQTIYSPGRGMIMEAAEGSTFSPPGNTPGHLGLHGFCSGRIAARGFFPDSLKVEILSDSGVSSIHWITGLKQSAPLKTKPSNRTRITIIYLGGDRFKTTISERPRLDHYSCSQYEYYCQEETWLRLLWKAVFP